MKQFLFFSNLLCVDLKYHRSICMILTNVTINRKNQKVMPNFDPNLRKLTSKGIQKK